MSRHIGVRIPDDLYNIVEQAAKEQDRTISALIVRTLRNVYDPRHNGELGGFAKLPELPEMPEMAVGSHIGINQAGPIAGLLPQADTRYRKCQHGDNEYTCGRTACKIKTGRS